MAFLNDWGKPENDPGEWIAAGKDGLRTVKCKIRAIPDDMLRMLLKRHFKNEKVDTASGRASMPVASSWEDTFKFGVDRAIWALVDTEEFFVRINDEESGRFYAKATGRNDQPFEVGEEVCLDGKWTDGIREHVLSKNGRFRQWVLDQAESVAKRANEHIAELEGNS